MTDSFGGIPSGRWSYVVGGPLNPVFPENIYFSSNSVAQRTLEQCRQGSAFQISDLEEYLNSVVHFRAQCNSVEGSVAFFCGTASAVQF